MAVLDWTGGFFMKTLTVDAYNGYHHCVGPNGICAVTAYGGGGRPGQVAGLSREWSPIRSR